ncbi:unnamed protein product [Lactuca virosa]|uniref:Uncharacterized protein n=1 Tax=Lactuca virosa TaxID=75947 RepID=A0AAU9M3A8_9ASTR|nr:unnamed protein product [Lactuca virosa]
MVKYGTFSKNLGPSSQSKPTYKYASCNLQAVLDAYLYDFVLSPLIKALKRHSFFILLTVSTANFPFDYIIKAHITTEVNDKLDRIKIQLINDDTINLTKHIFLQSIGLPRNVFGYSSVSQTSRNRIDQNKEDRNSSSKILGCLSRISLQHLQNSFDESLELFETHQTKRFSLPDQADFEATKCLPTALLDLIPRDSAVLAQHIKDTNEPKPEHPTPSSTRTLQKASWSEVAATPPKGIQVPKKKKANKKQKDPAISSPPPKRHTLLHTT